MNSIQRIGALVIGGALTTLAITTTVLSRSQERVRNTVYPAVLLDGSRVHAANARKAAEKRPLAFYQENVRAGLFAAPQPAPPAPLSRPPVVKPVNVETEAPPPPSPLPPDRFADYVYTGSVTIDGQIEALIENSESKEGWYVKPGDSFQGATVTSIDAQSVTLNVDGRPRLFVKSSDYNVVPLNTTAKGAQEGQGGAGQPTLGQPGSGDAGQTASRQPGRGALGGFGRPGGQGGFGGQYDFGGPGGPGGPGRPGGPGGFGGPPPQ